jgi:protein phosphatase methylesterase 1
MKKSSFIPKPKTNPIPLIPPKDSPKKDNSSDDEEEVNDELNDIIPDLKNIPNIYDIPQISSSSQTSISKRYSPIDWKTAFPETIKLNDNIPIYINGSKGPNLICLHGAGHSGLSFAPLALVNKNYRVISFDFRGHGYNTMSQGDDLSEENLINDTITVLNYINEKYPLDNIIVIGHSMGGSVATKTCEEIFKNQDKYKDLYDKIQGLMVIDVVEGTAMEALPFMENIVNNRPETFPSIEKGIEYMFRSGTIKNLQSAKISVPPLLEEIDINGKKMFKFKTNLMASKKYWNDWFIGLTKSFLSIKVPKTLMLAGIERMDKDLTIAQMQGKYKLSILRNVGHIMHEDAPDKVMGVIDDFIHTFRITPQLSEMIPVIGKLGNQNPEIPVIIKYEKNN